MIIILERTIDYLADLTKELSIDQKVTYIDSVSNSIWYSVTKDDMRITPDGIKYVKKEDEA